MARWIRDEQVGKPDDFVHYIMQDFLQKNGFTQKEYKGEMLWQEGTGMLAPPRFFKYSYRNGIIHIEAWMKFAWLPGVYSGENAMTGFVGMVPKKLFKESLENLVQLLYQPLPSDYNNAGNMSGINGAPVQGQPANGPVYVQGVDNAKYATMGLIFALLGLLGLYIPLIGVICAGVGIAYGNKGKGSSKSSMANAAFVIGIITMIISVVWWVLNIIAMVSL